MNPTPAKPLPQKPLQQPTSKDEDEMTADQWRAYLLEMLGPEKYKNL